VQTDIVKSVLAACDLIHSIIASPPFCSGMRITLGWGAFAKVYRGTIVNPPLARTGSAFSATVNISNDAMPRLGMLVPSKTAIGPQKSMTTAPSEIRTATGTPRSSGGFMLAIFCARSCGKSADAAIAPGRTAAA
jgi:hypothetical protein